MARRGSSFGLFGFIGRSADLRQCDQALRAVDLHPRVVPEAVKLTIVNLLKNHAGDSEPALHAYRAAAEIVGYCMLGGNGFAAANGAEPAAAVERRIEAALESGVSLDAQLVLSTLNAKVIQPDVVAQFELERVEQDGG